MAEQKKPRMNLQTRVALGLAGLFAVAAVARGFWLDAQPELTQPQLFWSFLALSLGGSLLGWRLGMRHDGHLGRNGLALFGALLAWRLSWFPLMVFSGWMASLGEAVTQGIAGVSTVFPTFLLAMFLLNLAIGAIAAMAVAVPQGEPPAHWLRRRLFAPPRPALWLLACVALPVAFLTSFSHPSDYVLFGDSPWQEAPALPAVRQPVSNPYAELLGAYGDRLSLGAKVLAFNARLTYPLVPDSPWARAVKGTLEGETRDHPIAGSNDRVRDHYLAYLAAQPALHGDTP